MPANYPSTTINLGSAPTSDDLDLRKQMALLHQLEAQAQQEQMKARLADPVEAAHIQATADQFASRTGVGKFTPTGKDSYTNLREAPTEAAPSGSAVPFTSDNFQPVSAHAEPKTVKNITKLPTAPDASLRMVPGVRSSNTALTDPEAAMTTEQRNRISPAVLAAEAKADSDKLVKVEHKDPATGRTVIEWLPQNQLRGQTFQKGTGATTENRLASAEAVNQTGDDMIAKLSDPAYAKQVGVAMGRYNNMRDFIGNPPPEFSDLAGMMESYSLANMGVHGMRSAQGAEQIKHLLDQKHTPESLIATIRGLNQFSSHFMANEGRTVGDGSTGAGGMTAAKDPYDEYLARKK